MGILTRFLDKKQEKVEPEAVSSDESDLISEEMRQKAYLALESRKENYELKKLEREKEKILRKIQLEEARAELHELQRELRGETDDDDDEPEDQQMALMLKLADKFLNNPPAHQQANAQPQPEDKRTALLDDDTLKVIASKLPNNYKDHFKQIDEGSLIRLKEIISTEE